MAEREKPKLQHVGGITDARGRKVPQLDPIALYLLRRHEWIEADTLHAIVHEEGVRVGRSERISVFVGVVGLMVIAGFFIRSLVVETFGAAPYARTSALLYFAFMPWWVWTRLKRHRFGKVAAAMLKYSRCPHCGYDLRMLPVDPGDAATICPECGCAWMLTDV